MSLEVGSRIAKNSIFSFLRAVLALPITLFLTPYIIGHLGKAEFGIWALVGVISSYAQLSDFGIAESLVKFVAEFKARDDKLMLNRLLNTAFTVYILTSIFFCVVFIFIIPFFVDSILKIPSGLQSKAIYVFNVAIILFFINMLMGVFGSLIIGFERMDYSNSISLISTILMAVGTVMFLNFGYGLEGLIYNNAIVAGFIILANILVALRLFPELRINPFRYFNVEVFKKLFSFSWKIQITNITQLMIFQIDRILLSHYVGLTAVGYYEVAVRVVTQARNFVIALFTPMVPAASALYSVEETKNKIAGLYRRSFKYMVISAIPFSFLIIALAHPFVRIWMGPGYETSAYTMQFLMGIYLLNLLTGPGAFILNGINKPEIGMKSSVVAGITNIILCWVLVQQIGYYGIIIGIFVSIFTSGCLFMWMLHRNLEGIIKSTYNLIVLPLATAAFMGILLVFLDKLWGFIGYPTLIVLGLCYFLLFMLVMLRAKYFDEFDRETLHRFLKLRS